MITTKIDYAKRCWYCDKEAMVSKGAYYQCSNCGATWNELPVLGPPLTILESDQGRGQYEGLHKRSLSPAPGVTRKARKQRETKEVKS